MTLEELYQKGYLSPSESEKQTDIIDKYEDFDGYGYFSWINIGYKWVHCGYKRSRSAWWCGG